ncbi:hypothetical protein CK203_045710 [Vitis vinifera]|uniref:Uncharacterized protein n=1 Tax=Vitis vinifera TaxID=29760 RepID=A0A438I0W8_VITVI|nr:hypothetical protein CK203_045710 [Vitis vinifera]
MIMRSLQPEFARHLMGFPYTDFGSLVHALYGTEEGIARGLCPESSPTDFKRKKPLGRKRSRDISAISLRDLLPHTLDLELHRPLLMCKGHHISLLSWDLIDQGLVNLGQPSVTTNPLPTHSTHAVPPPPGDIHHIDFIKDDNIHMLSWDDGLPESIVLHENYEVDDVGIPLFRSLYSQMMMIQKREIQIVTCCGRIAQSPPPAIRPFEDDDLPPEDLDHVCPLYITVGCLGQRVPFVLLDNGSALNICHLATTIALDFTPSDFVPSTQTLRVLRILTSFNLLLGQPWIHTAGVIHFSLHQKVKFIHDGQVITTQSTRDIFASFELILQISHSKDDLFLTGFTFDEIQTLEIEDFCRDFVAMSFDQHSSTVVLDMMRGMSFLPGMGLGLR